MSIRIRARIHPSVRISALALALLCLSAPAVRAQCGSGQELFGAPTAAGDRFGWSVALSGAHAVVGAPWASPTGALSGAAYLFEDGGPELGWSQAQVLAPSDPHALDMYGYSVAIDGDTALVSAWHAPEGGLERGLVYVFGRQGSSWVQTAKLAASDGADYDFFGVSVAIDGDRAVVGAHGVDGPVPNQGAAYVFDRVGGSWSQTAKLVSGAPDDHAFLGWDVAVDADRVVAGAPALNAFGFNPGSAHVFERTGGVWAEVAALTAADLNDGQQFGKSVAIAGDQVLIGAAGDDDLGATSGSAYVFRRLAGVWVEAQELHDPFGDATDFFGWSVALRDGAALVGAPGDGSGSAFGAGAAHQYVQTTAGWAHRGKLVAFDGVPPDNLGYAVDLAPGRAMFSAIFDDSAGADAGAVWIVDPCLGFTPYCFCGDGAPCGNADAGAGCRNSTGGGALLTHLGSNSVSLDDLVLTLAGLPPNQFAILFMGDGAVSLPFGDGRRCVESAGLGVFRFAIQGSGAGGAITLGPGIVAESESAFPASGAIDAGERWNFQGWYRDPGGPCGSGFNLSNALGVRFTP